MKCLFAAICTLAAAMMASCAPLMSVESTLAERREVPVLMYHSILRDPDRSGKYILPPAVLEEDIRWLLAHGYETVTGRELAAFVKDGAPLPDHPVLLTFDDGYLNNLTYVLPLLEKYDCRAVISIVGAYTDRFTKTPDPNPNYAHVSWDDVKTLSQSGRVEVGNHTYELHGQSGRMGSARKSGESEADYAAMFTADVGRLQDALKRHTGSAAVTFAYPYGVVDPASAALLDKMGLCVTLSCAERISTVVRGEPDSLLLLGRYNRAGGMSTEAFMAKLFGVRS